MKIPVVLKIRSEQRYEGIDPDNIELVTNGFMEKDGEDGWKISYDESELTGMQGVTTSFAATPDRVVLQRTGALHSEMIFEVNVRHDSLYEMPFGAMMMGICARRIRMEMSEEGGFLEVFYDIRLENTQAGMVLYHMDVAAR